MNEKLQKVEIKIYSENSLKKTITIKKEKLHTIDSTWNTDEEEWFRIYKELIKNS